jgi:RNA polymerase sigma-70 factor, ECF subfamily
MPSRQPTDQRHGWSRDRRQPGDIPGIKRGSPGSTVWRMASRSFDDTVLPHLNAAFNYARWLTRNDADAEDVVQDACVRAVRFFASLRDNDARAWLLTIVRNAWFSRVGRRTPETHSIHLSELTDEPSDSALDPEALLSQRDTVAHVRKALTELPVDFREVIVLRELEGFSYKEIAMVIDAPIGTVMSRLARARERLSAVLQQPLVGMENAQ